MQTILQLRPMAPDTGNAREEKRTHYRKQDDEGRLPAARDAEERLDHPRKLTHACIAEPAERIHERTCWCRGALRREFVIARLDSPKGLAARDGRLFG